MGLIPGRSTRWEAEETQWAMTWPNLIMREWVALLAALGVLMLVSLFFDAPLEGIANPAVTPNPAKAPWYFLGLQELLHYGNPLIMGILLPGVAISALMALPYLDRNPSSRPRDRKWAIGIFTTVVVVFGILTVIGTFFRGPGWEWVWPWQASGH
ncbi:hypothetical protein SY88_05355 [Clostridiales bacterium PH28_bin88]|nr:hypothetical protein SY88_05355 [Clostridiales bacterium PH28_bin88]